MHTYMYTHTCTHTLICIHALCPTTGQSQVYTPAWRSHVLAHLPLYSVLLPAFLELAYSQMAYSGRPALREAYRVLKTLAESGPALVAELRTAEAAYNRCAATLTTTPSSHPTCQRAVCILVPARFLLL